MKAGRIFIALLILAGAVGVIVTGATVYSRLLYLGLLVGVGSSVWTFFAGRSLSLQRNAREQRANVGDIFEERFEVVNGGRWLAPWVEVRNDSPLPHSSGSRVLTMLPGKQKRNYLARTWLTRRGAFALGPTRLSTGDPFGIFRSSRDIPAAQTLVVLPLLFEIKSFVFPPGLLSGGQVIRQKSSDITPHAAGVREYMHGDEMKRIHWPTSIRRNHLMVKEFEQDPQAAVWLFFDAQRDVHVEKPHVVEDMPVENMLFGRRPKFQMPPSTLEYAVTITASLAHYFLSQRRAVGFASAGQTFTVHSAERSDRQEAKILETLAFVEANGNLSLAALVAAQASQLSQGSSAILITPTVRSDLLTAVDDLQRRRLRPIVILLDARSFNGSDGTEGLARSLGERRVPVYIIRCDTDLASSLSSFSSEFGLQDLRKWQNPILSQ